MAPPYLHRRERSLRTDDDQDLTAGYCVFQSVRLLPGDSQSDEHARNPAAITDVVDDPSNVRDEVTGHEHAAKAGYQQRFEGPKDVQKFLAGVTVDGYLEVLRGAGLLVQPVDLGERARQDTDVVRADPGRRERTDCVQCLLVAGEQLDRRPILVHAALADAR